MSQSVESLPASLLLGRQVQVGQDLTRGAGTPLCGHHKQTTRCQRCLLFVFWPDPLSALMTPSVLSVSINNNNKKKKRKTNSFIPHSLFPGFNLHHGNISRIYDVRCIYINLTLILFNHDIYDTLNKPVYFTVTLQCHHSPAGGDKLLFCDWKLIYFALNISYYYQ